MDVADRRPVGQPVERLDRRIVELSEEALDVERQRRHALHDLSLPLLTRPVGIDLDAVPVRIAEVDRLAHRVVREPFDPSLVACSMREPAREARPVGHEQRNVIEAGVTVGRSRPGLFDEADELGVGAERGETVLAASTRSPTTCSQ